ncbi:unnamed protein product [Orchesella dallaii]|uniref:Uncharacterized protein n=1 Tax=Orchesella dallaii TaxID=48710 RepID=A0ABP1PTL5_9HEXA
MDGGKPVWLKSGFNNPDNSIQLQLKNEISLVHGQVKSWTVIKYILNIPDELCLQLVFHALMRSEQENEDEIVKIQKESGEIKARLLWKITASIGSSNEDGEGDFFKYIRQNAVKDEMPFYYTEKYNNRKKIPWAYTLYEEAYDLTEEEEEALNRNAVASSASQSSQEEVAVSIDAAANKSNFYYIIKIQKLEWFLNYNYPNL